MPKQPRFEFRFVDRVMSNVRRILSKPSDVRFKLAALQTISAKLFESAEKCRLRCERARVAGNSKLETALLKKWKLLDNAVRYVSASAVSLVLKKPRYGFALEPAHFAMPRWER